MASTYNYIPNSDNDRIMWLNNFTVKLPAYASLLGIPNSEVTSVQKDNDMYEYLGNMAEAYKRTLHTITAYRNLLRNAVHQQHLGPVPVPPVLSAPPPLVPEGIFNRMSKLIQRIKASANYTDNIGEDLGIVKAAKKTDRSVLQPKLKIMLNAGMPYITCARNSADAMDLYVDRKDGNGFVTLGRLLKFKYTDKTPLPIGQLLADWHYKAMYVIGNDNAGLMSHVVSIVVKKM
ncbi:MAG: hypothetical protein V4580_15030 [Bacteroidota bacterium]